MNKKAIEALRNGLEDSYWYGEKDAEVFEELVRKAEAFDEIKGIKEQPVKNIRAMVEYNDDVKAIIKDYERTD